MPGAAVPLSTLCVVQRVPPPASALVPLCPGCPSPPALGPGPSRAGGRASPDPSAGAALPAPPARSVHLLVFPSPCPAWNECVFSWADQRPVGVQVSVGVFRTSWVTLGVSEPRAPFLAGRGSHPESSVAPVRWWSRGLSPRSGSPFPGCSPVPLAGPFGQLYWGRGSRPPARLEFGWCCFSWVPPV